MRIAVVGVGAIGTIIGALLTENGHDVELVDNYKEHVEALRNNGAKIIGEIEKTIPVKAIYPDELSGKYDLVISTTKHGALEASLLGIKPFTHDETVILTLQNGIPEEKSRKIYNEKNLMGGGVELSGTFIGPGVSKLASGTETMCIYFGSYEGSLTDKVFEVKKILECIGRAEVTDNLRGVRLTKLTDNSCFSGLPTALGCTVGEVLDNDFALECAAHLNMECAEIIEKLGVTPVELFGLLPVKQRLGFTNKEEKEKVKAYLIRIYTPFRAQIASMLQDIRKGKSCEINEINGEMVRLAETVGVDAPFNRKIVELVTKLQNREIELKDAWNNLEEFKKLQ